MNQSSGYLLRTKPANEDEGGVSVGVASLNTVSLVSEEEYLQTIVTWLREILLHYPHVNQSYY